MIKKIAGPSWAITALLFTFVVSSYGQMAKKAGPIIENGEAQVVEAFSDPSKWIRHDLWVETEFDSDGDGKLDRMHVEDRKSVV